MSKYDIRFDGNAPVEDIDIFVLRGGTPFMKKLPKSCYSCPRYPFVTCPETALTKMFNSII